jgi:hypothetical protein
MSYDVSILPERLSTTDFISRFTYLQRLTLRYSTVFTNESLHGLQWSAFLKKLYPCPTLQAITLIVKVSPNPASASPVPQLEERLDPKKNSAWTLIDQHLSDKVLFPRLGKFVVLFEYVTPEEIGALRSAIEGCLPILAGSGKLMVFR